DVGQGENAVAGEYPVLVSQLGQGRTGGRVIELENGNGIAFQQLQAFEPALADIHVKHIRDNHGLGVVGVQGNRHGLTQGFQGEVFNEHQRGIEVVLAFAYFDDIAV